MGCDYYRQFLASQTTIGDGQTLPASREHLLADAMVQALGVYIFIDFLNGTKIIDRQEGYLAAVGIDYIILYNPTIEMYIYGSMYSIKFIYFSTQVDYSVVLDWDVKLDTNIV